MTAPAQAMTIVTECGLCGLPTGNNERFCCPGCGNVYAILEESGVIKPGVDLRDTELFKRSLEMGLISNRKAADASAIPADAPVEERLMQISGMWCASCGWLIEHALKAERGVVSVEVFFASDLLKVRYSPVYLPPERIEKRVASLGYQAQAYSPETANARGDSRESMLRVGIAAFLWLNVMMFNLAIYTGYFENIPDSIHRLFPFLLMTLSMPVVTYCAYPILRIAWFGLRERVIRMETLLTLGILAAWSYSAWQAFHGGTHFYFDISCAIVTLVLLGKRMERAAKERTARSISMLYRLMPKKARLLVDGRERFVSIDALIPGETFLVKAGERIPADGVVARGESHADESLLTGESAPVPKLAGSTVVGGSVNGSGILEVRATRTAAESALAQIVKTVETALATRPAIEKTVDQVSRVFVPAVLALAAGVAAWGIWNGSGTTGDALLRSITILVIACPCALGIATPLAITAAIGAASRRGILISDTRALETARKVDVVLFDKTGTITEGNYSLLEVSNDDLPLLAALEQYSEHPLGQAIVRRARELNIEPAGASDVQIHKGMGITGVVNGKQVFIGNRTLTGALDAMLEMTATAWEVRGATVALYGWNGAVRGLIAFGDRIKPGARETISEFRRRNIHVAIVSGDSPKTTAWVAKEVNANDFHAGILPEDKTRIVREFQQKGACVAMAGDGINDAPALAQADLSIALGSGTDLAMRAAGLVLMNNQPEGVLQAYDLSLRTMRVIRQNLFWAFFYNTAGISLAAMDLLNPIVAAVAMVVSSLSVIANSLRLSNDKH